MAVPRVTLLLPRLHREERTELLLSLWQETGLTTTVSGVDSHPEALTLTHVFPLVVWMMLPTNFLLLLHCSKRTVYNCRDLLFIKPILFVYIWKKKISGSILKWKENPTHNFSVKPDIQKSSQKWVKNTQLLRKQWEFTWICVHTGLVTTLEHCSLHGNKPKNSCSAKNP